MKIKVTQEHIDQGKRYSTHYCPVAIALYPIDINPSVGVTSLSIQKGRFAIPKIGQEFIRKFDGEQPVQPIEFEVTKLE